MKSFSSSRNILGVCLAGMMAAAGTTYADTTASAPATGTQSSFSNTLQTIRKNTTGSYQMWFRGPNVQALSGNTDGNGTNLAMTHYLALGYKVGSKWRIGLTQPFTQLIDEVPAQAKDPFVANDPYITFTNPRIVNSKKYGTNLYGYLRYYAPLSRSTNQLANYSAASSANLKKGIPGESGNGRVRMYLGPTKTFFDGALTVNAQMLFQYNLASRTEADRIAVTGSPHRNDLTFIFDPLVSYSVTDKLDVYLEYAFDITRSTSGKWTDWKDTDYISPGVYYSATKRLWLNPYVSFAPKFSELAKTGIGFQAVYSFL